MCAWLVACTVASALGGSGSLVLLLTMLEVSGCDGPPVPLYQTIVTQGTNFGFVMVERGAFGPGNITVRLRVTLDNGDSTAADFPLNTDGAVADYTPTGRMVTSAS